MAAPFWTIYMGIYGGGVIDDYVPTIFVSLNRYNSGAPDVQINKHNSGCPDVQVNYPYFR